MMHPETVARLETTTDYFGFERLCCEALAAASPYAAIVPRGLGGSDRGMDASIVRRDKATLAVTERVAFHFSTEKQISRKIKSDLQRLKDEGCRPELSVVVTNRRCPSPTRDRLAAWARLICGWDLEIYDRDWLALQLDGPLQRVRREFLGIEYDSRAFADLSRILRDPSKHPNEVELESGQFFDRPQQGEILDILREGRVALLYGAPGTGKTSVAQACGYALLKRDVRQVVFYTSRRNPVAVGDLLVHIKSMDYPHATFIVDDCHLDVDAVNELASRRFEVDHARILFISREVDLALTGQFGESFFDQLRHSAIRLDLDEGSLRGIALVLAGHGIASQAIEPLEPLLERCEGDIHLLRFLVGAWLDLDDPSVALADVSESCVHENVYRRYLARSRHHEEICTLAALSQFEIAVESSWLGRQQVVEGIVSQGFADRLVQKRSGRSVELLQFFHATPARHVVRAAEARGILGRRNAHEFSADECTRYLLHTPSNFFAAAGQLARAAPPDIIETFLSDERLGVAGANIFAAWKSRPNPRLLADAMYLALRQRRLGTEAAVRAAEALSAALRERYGDATGHRLLGRTLAVPYLVHLLQLTGDTSWNWVLERVEVAHLAKLARISEIKLVSDFLRAAKRCGWPEQDLAAFMAALDVSELASRVGRAGSLSSLTNFVRRGRGYGLSEQQEKQLWEHVDFAKLGWAGRHLSLTSVSRFLQIVRRVAPAGALETFFSTYALQDRASSLNRPAFSTVKNLLHSAAHASVSERTLRMIAARLDFYALGKGIRKTTGKMLTLPDISFLWSEYIPDRRVRDFLKGMKIEHIADQCRETLSPDVISALFYLFRDRGDIKRPELEENGLDFLDPRLWENAFTRPRQIFSDVMEGIQSRYMGDAFNRFCSLSPQFGTKLARMPLSSWAIFMHNGYRWQKARTRVIVLEALNALGDGEFLRLLCDADLYNLSNFCGRMGRDLEISHPAWSAHSLAPSDLSLASKIPAAAFGHIVHMLFAFHWLDRPDMSAAFAGEVLAARDCVSEKIADSSGAEIDLFLWNLFVVSPPAADPVQALSIFDATAAAAIARQKATQEAMAGICGTYWLAGIPTPAGLRERLDRPHLIEMIQRYAAMASPDLPRLLAAALALGLPLDGDVRSAAEKALQKIRERSPTEHLKALFDKVALDLSATETD